MVESKNADITIKINSDLKQLFSTEELGKIIENILDTIHKYPDTVGAKFSCKNIDFGIVRTNEVIYITNDDQMIAFFEDRRDTHEITYF